MNTKRLGDLAVIAYTPNRIISNGKVEIRNSSIKIKVSVSISYFPFL
jgi:hypothetical protein